MIVKVEFLLPETILQSRNFSFLAKGSKPMLESALANLMSIGRACLKRSCVLNLAGFSSTFWNFPFRFIGYVAWPCKPSNESAILHSTTYKQVNVFLLVL